jgi:hypothetical protein
MYMSTVRAGIICTIHTILDAIAICIPITVLNTKPIGLTDCFTRLIGINWIVVPFNLEPCDSWIRG